MDMFNSPNFQEAYMNISKPLFTNSSNPYAVNAHTRYDLQFTIVHHRFTSLP